MIFVILGLIIALFVWNGLIMNKMFFSGAGGFTYLKEWMWWCGMALSKYYRISPNIKSTHCPSTLFILETVKPVLSGLLTIDKTKILMANCSLMKVESIAECSPWSML